VITYIAGEGRLMTRIGHPIDQAEVTRIADKYRAVLFAAAVAYDEAIDLWANREVTTLEEVQTLTAFMARTDAPLRWHQAAR